MNPVTLLADVRKAHIYWPSARECSCGCLLDYHGAHAEHVDREQAQALVAWLTSDETAEVARMATPGVVWGPSVARNALAAVAATMGADT